MTRTILAGLAAAVSIVILSGTGCQSTGVGDPCVPEQEYDPAFLGFASTEVSVESRSFQCQTRLCLVNHFQGRVKCPYGQQASGLPKAGTKKCTTSVPRPDATCATTQTASDWGCCTPGTGVPVSGLDKTCSLVDSSQKAEVKPQCTDRLATNAVYCSCRCANEANQTNDGANYCTCPDGFSCTQLVTSIATLDKGLTGAYCVRNNTQYDPGSSCPTCDPLTANCGDLQLISTK